MQTITKLNLEWNGIGDEGAKHLADALENNKVIHCTFSSISFHPQLQTITKLDLDSNKIGSEGVKHLAEAIRKNQVKQNDYHLYYSYFCVIYRYG